MKFLASNRFKKLVKQTATFSLLLSFSVYSWARILFYEVPFTIAEDLPIMAKIMILCWVMVLALGIVFNIILKIGQWIQQPGSASLFYKKWIVTVLAVLFVSAISFLL
jgi:hypothetical protein